MLYNSFQDLKLSALGFGAMRLPLLDNGSVDQAELDRMVDAAMAAGVNVADNLLHAGAVVADDTVAAVVGMIDNHGRDTAGGKPDNAGGIIVRLHNNHAVQAALAGMFIVIGFGIAALTEKSQVVSVLVRFTAEFIKKGTEVFMVHPVFVENSQIVGTACFQRSGCRVRIITHITRGLADRGSPLPVFIC